MESLEAVRVAHQIGADRVELCSDLLEGGLTPSWGMTKLAVDVGIDVMAMIRPRGGDFLYLDDEFDVMLADIAGMKQLGVRGVVFGLLNPEGTIDAERTRVLCEAARPLEVTFHRAFDMTPDPFAALETLAELGVARVLTSGQRDLAVDGVDLLRRLVEKSEGRVVIMPGGGLTVSDLPKVIRQTKATEIHIAALTMVPSNMQHRNPNVTMGAGEPPSEYERRTSDPDELARMLECLRSI